MTYLIGLIALAGVMGVWMQRVPLDPQETLQFRRQRQKRCRPQSLNGRLDRPTYRSRLGRSL